MAWQFKPGDVVDSYVVESQLGMGGVGEVYVAVHQFTKRKVALKCLQGRRLEVGDFAARMRAEAQVLSELDHPNVVRLHDANVTPQGVVWMATELLRGRTLREFCRERGPLPPALALHFAAEIGDAVAAAHAIQVWHRDLKPENVFITEETRVKVLDFGTAKFVNRGVKTTDHLRILGTPFYMAPEQFAGLKVDGRVDVYALGLILYEMILGHHAFAFGANNQGLPRADQMGQVQLFAQPTPLTEKIPGFPPYIWQVVERALVKERDQRYATMAELVSVLRATRQRLLAEAGAMAVSPTYSPATPRSTSTAQMPAVSPSNPPPSPAHPSLAPMAYRSSTPPPSSMPMTTTPMLREAIQASMASPPRASALPASAPPVSASPSRLQATARMDEGAPLPSVTPARPRLAETARMEDGAPISRLPPPVSSKLMETAPLGAEARRGMFEPGWLAKPAPKKKSRAGAVVIVIVLLLLAAGVAAWLHFLR